MSPLAALILGLIQGATEFLPVSSSAHLALAHWLFGWNVADNLTFDVALHFGTMVALLAYFWRDWMDFFKRRDRLVGYVLVACIPGALAGAKFEELAETTFRNPLQIASLLALMGLVMGLAEWRGKRTREVGEMGWADAIIIGLAQALAIMPGVSRAGVTMTTGLFLGLSREAAARFSFLLATPILLGATLYSSRKLVGGGISGDALPLLVGVLAAGLSGWACIHFLLHFLKRHTFYGFVIYRVLLAVAVVAVGLWVRP